MTKIECTRRDLLKSAGRWGISAMIVPVSQLTASESTGSIFYFVQMCDTQLGFGGYDHDVNTFQQAVKQINTLQPDFAVICGDLVNTPKEKSLADKFADFNKIKARLTVPCYCAPGNHDIGYEPTHESLKYYRKVIGKDYYSFAHKGYVFVIVNTQLWKVPLKDESEKHDAWFKATLENAVNNDARIFIIGHYPLFHKKADEEEKPMNLPLAKRKEILDLFTKYNIVAMLGGHTHRLLINEYQGIQLVNGETTSKNLDKRPLGFRLWDVTDSRPFKHKFIPLEHLTK